MNGSTKHASVYDIPERPRAHVPKPSLVRYEEFCSTINNADVDEEHCITGYGEVIVSDQYGEGGVYDDERKQRAPRLKYTRPRSRYQGQTSGTDSDAMSSLYTGGLVRFPLTGDPEQLDSEYFRNAIKGGTSPDRPVTPNTDFREFFETLLRKTPPTRRKHRSLVLRDSPASEAVDALPRPN